MSDLYHLSTPPKFAYEKGQSFKLKGDEDPDEYWFILNRVWNYDADTENDYWPPGHYHRQYQIGEVSSMGGNQRLATEAELLEHYEPVSKEQATEVL